MTLTIPDTPGRAVISRTLNQVIDREETKFFNGPTDLLTYTVTVCDNARMEDGAMLCSGNMDSIRILISVEDRNDK